MIMAKLKSAKGKKFLFGLLAVFIIAASVVSRDHGGVIEQYNIPLSEWTTSMYVIQSSMIFVYSLVFTVLLAIPLGIYFLGGEEQVEKIGPIILALSVIESLIVFFVIQFVSLILVRFNDQQVKSEDDQSPVPPCCRGMLLKYRCVRPCPEPQSPPVSAPPNQESPFCRPFLYVRHVFINAEFVAAFQPAKCCPRMASL